ncbi:hemicentin-2-like isoform X1 [Acanthaster planci]|uniref:Hemicentin-2-like isoform X1 n=1 Tax=Acanthaster planci TaxID=133434 RepID=A0A8B7Y8P2_ACAPL|nr:hemicentin-2-like isoform X1 [Acanthaster planci]
MAPALGTLHLQLLIGFLCTAHCQSQVIVTVTINGQTGVVDGFEGDSIELLCQVQNLTGQAVVWSKGSTQITPQPGKYSLTSNETEGRFTLTIVNLTRTNDRGTFNCEVGGIGSSIVGSVGVRVNYFPDAGNPMCFGPTVIEEGTPAVFRCESLPGEPLIEGEWLRDDGRVVEADNIKTGLPINNMISFEYTIMPSPLDIGINVTCKISSVLSFPGRTSSCTIGPLVVKFSPRDVSITNTTYSQDNVMYDAITCSAIAYPPNISYSWSFNTPLDPSQQTLTDGNQTLVILNITSCKATIIATCLATNKVGSETANFTVCEPPPPTTTEVTTQEETTTATEETEAHITITSVNPFSVETEPQMTTDNMTMVRPQASILTPALYAIIICGACIVLVSVIGVAFLFTQKKSNKDNMDDDGTAEVAFQVRNVRALSIALFDGGDEMQTEMMMANRAFQAGDEMSKNEQDCLDALQDSSVNFHPPGDVTPDVISPESASVDEAPELSSAAEQEETPSEDSRSNADHSPHKAEANATLDDGDECDEMFAPPIEEEAQAYQPDPRKSLVQEALLAVQIDKTNTAGSARAGHKVTQEMEI